MKKLYGVLAVCAVLAAAPAAQAAIADFEDLALGTNSAWTGSYTWNWKDPLNLSASSTFSSGGTEFNNTETVLNIWEGFAYSNITSPTLFTTPLSAKPGGGANGSSTYAVVNPSTLLFNTPATAKFNGTAQEVQGFNIANTTAVFDVLSFSDRWLDIQGTLQLNVYGLDDSGLRINNSVANYILASQNGLLSNWDWVDLRALGAVYGLEFEIESSVNVWGKEFGLGTDVPVTFAMDNLTVGAAAPVPVPAAAWLLGAGLLGLVGVRRRSGR